MLGRGSSQLFRWDYNFVNTKTLIEGETACLNKPISVKVQRPSKETRLLVKEHKEKVWKRYNQLFFCNYWANLLKSVGNHLIRLRYNESVHELSAFYEECQKELQMEYPGSEPYNGNDFLLEHLVQPTSETGWQLVYRDTDEKVWDIFANMRSGRIAPSVKFNGGATSFFQRFSGGGITVIEIFTFSLQMPGTDMLKSILRRYNPNFMRL